MYAWVGWLLGWSIAAALAPIAHAAAPAPLQAYTHPADDAFVAARQAFVAQDRVRLERAARAAAEHPLSEYLDYWRWALAVRGTPASPDLVNGVERFIADARNPMLAEALRREWILALGRAERWDAVLAHDARLTNRDDPALACLGWHARLVAGEPLDARAREALLAPRELVEPCNDLLQAAAVRGLVSRDDLRLRVRRSAEAGASASARRAGALLGMDLAELDTAFRDPVRVLKRGVRSDEPLLVALATLARRDPGAAAERIDALEASTSDRAYAWAVAAAAAAQRLMPEAAAWARKGVDAPVSDDVRAWMARAALAANDWALLHDVLLGMSDEGLRDATWAYWLGRAYKALGYPEVADAVFRPVAGQLDFYGQLAAEQLGVQATLPPAAAPASAEELRRAKSNAGLQRAMRLYAMGLRSDANREWNFQLRAMGDRELLAAAAYACEHELYDRCVNTADRTRAEHDFRLRFLAPFRNRLPVLAREQGLDPAWVYGLIRQESRFMLGARSHVGAQGLMQIMPATGQWIARQIGHLGFRTDQLHDIETNLRFGTYYLKDVAGRLEHSVVMATAAYNAGPGRPARWRKMLAGPVDGAAFAEIIPFDETRDYVKKVLWNAGWYAALFGGRAGSLHERLGTVSPGRDALAQNP